MGEAKRRGTFEERKAQAIAEGRSKNKPEIIEDELNDYLASLSYGDAIRQQNIWVIQQAVRRLHTLS